MPTVSGLRVNAIELPQSLRQVAIHRFDEEMVVVIYQAVSVQAPVEALRNSTEGLQQQLTIFIVFNNSLLPITPRRYVIQGTLEF